MRYSHVWEVLGLLAGRQEPPVDVGAFARLPPAAKSGGMVAAANPDAVDAGLRVLRDGGDAVDAAIAVQLVLGLVEPQSSGIGGGAWLVRYDNASQRVAVYDGRETAPAAANESMFLGAGGEPLPIRDAWRSGRAIGVPGVVSMLASAHEDHGRRPWAELFDAATRLASDGFSVAKRLHDSTNMMKSSFQSSEETRAAAKYLYDANGGIFPVGHRLKNQAYAETMRSLARDWRSFYGGELAAAVVATAREDPSPSAMAVEDLARYKAMRRRPLCPPYRGFQVCSAPPPSSGGVGLGEILGVLESFNMSAHGPESPEAWELFIEASRLAYADRDRYVADPAFAQVPVEGLLDRKYLAERAKLIDAHHAMLHAEAGTPPGAPSGPTSKDGTVEAGGTSHFVIVDGRGNVVSMTTSVARPFGSGRFVRGFFLNNQLSDFAFVPRDAEGRLHANAASPGKRPRSSMSPSVVLDGGGRFVLATGSPGGSAIVAYTAKSLVAMLDWGLSPQEAAALPNVVPLGDVVKTDADFNISIAAVLRKRGFVVEVGMDEKSGIHTIAVGPSGSLVGGADPRRDGVVGQL